MKDGGPAFPHTMAYADGVFDKGHWGMSLRDWFAGMAIRSCMEFCIKLEGMTWTRDNLPAGTAQLAYDMADAMLAEREKSDADR